MKAPRIETAEQLEEIVDQQNQRIAEQTRTIHDLDELVRAMDQRIKLLTALLDSDHAVLSKLAGLPPRPKGDRLAN